MSQDNMPQLPAGMQWLVQIRFPDQRLHWKALVAWSEYDARIIEKQWRTQFDYMLKLGMVLECVPRYCDEQMHAYARQYAEMRVKEEREACAAECEKHSVLLYSHVKYPTGTMTSWEYRGAGAFRCSQLIRARSGAQQ